MHRYVAILTAGLFVAAAATAGELDREFGAKPTTAAPPAAKPVAEFGVLLGGTGASEMDEETPAQAHRRGGWYGGYRGGWGHGWSGGWSVGYSGYHGGWGACPRYSYYAWPTYAYYPPVVHYGYYRYPAWNYCW